MALVRARRMGESLSSRPARFAEAPPPQPSPAKSGRGSTPPSPVQLDLISSCSSYGAIRFNLSNSQGKQDFERHDLAVSRRPWRPSWCRKARPRNKEGAGKTGCRPHPWPACNKKSRRQSPQAQPNHPAFPARWCYGFLRALPGDRALLPPSSLRGCFSRT
jgi:hypothetical protein